MIASPDELRNKFIPCQVNPSNTNGSGATSGAKGSGRESYDDINWLQNAANAGDIGNSFASGNYQNGFSSILKMILSFVGSQEAASAKVETSQNQSKIDNTQKEIETANKDAQQQMDQIKGLIDQLQQAMEEKSKQAEQLQLDIKAEQEKSQEIAEEIEQAKEDLKNAKSQDEIAKALSTLQGCAAALAGVVESVEAKIEEVNSVQADLSSLQEDFTPLQGQIEQVFNQNQTKTQKLQQDLNNEKIDVNTSDATGEVNENTSDTAGETATELETSSSIPVVGTATSSLAPKCREVERDQGTAGDTRKNATAPQTNNITQAGSQTSSLKELVQTWANQQIGRLPEIGNTIGSALQSLDSTIQSVGSIDSFKKDVEDFSKIVEEDMANAGVSGSESGNISGDTEISPINNNDKESNNSESAQEFKVLEFDTTVFSKAFGI